MAGENKRVKRYRRKVVDLTNKLDFMTEMIMKRDKQIESLKRSVDILSAPEKEEDHANEIGEGAGEGQEDRPDPVSSEENRGDDE
jgi:hypothetical protein